MPRTQNTWPRFDIHIIDEVIKNPNPKISLSVSSMYRTTLFDQYMDDTDSDILGLGFLITSSIMWISNRGHVFCVRGIRLHPTGVFSNVLMTKKRHDNRKTSDWSKSDCSVRGRYQQRYLVYYKGYRNDFLQRRIWSETVSSDEIWAGHCKKHWSYSRSYNLRQVDRW